MRADLAPQGEAATPVLLRAMRAEKGEAVKIRAYKGEAVKIRAYKGQGWLQIQTLKGAELRRAYARARRRSDYLNDLFIEVGRGSWRNADVVKAADEGDTLAVAEMDIRAELHFLHARAESWYGPGSDVWLLP